MATTKSKLRGKKPLKVQLLNASGKIVEGIIPSGKWPDEDPALAIAKELGKYKHLRPTPIPGQSSFSPAVKIYIENLLSRITTDPNICHGNPVIRGLHYPVETMLELMGSGMTHKEILADYKDLKEQDLLACLLFAALVIKY